MLPRHQHPLHRTLQYVLRLDWLLLLAHKSQYNGCLFVFFFSGTRRNHRIEWVMNTTSKFCLIKGDGETKGESHESQHIFFSIEKQGFFVSEKKKEIHTVVVSNIVYHTNTHPGNGSPWCMIKCWDEECQAKRPAGIPLSPLPGPIRITLGIGIPATECAAMVKYTHHTHNASFFLFVFIFFYFATEKKDGSRRAREQKRDSQKNREKQQQQQRKLNAGKPMGTSSVPLSISMCIGTDGCCHDHC